MPQSSQPLFLARRSYRRRRLMDAARMLPVLGAVLILLPGLWNPAETPAPDTGRGGLYLFAVWLGLIVAGALVAHGLAPVLDSEDAPERGEAEGRDATDPARVRTGDETGYETGARDGDGNGGRDAL